MTNIVFKNVRHNIETSGSEYNAHTTIEAVLIRKIKRKVWRENAENEDDAATAAVFYVLKQHIEEMGQ